MIFDHLAEIWGENNNSFYIDENNQFSFKDLKRIEVEGLDVLKEGDVVSLIGDFDPHTIATFLRLIDLKVIIVPLTLDTEMQHNYFLDQSKSQYVFKKNKLCKIITKVQYRDKLIDNLRARMHPGLILFTSGTTGRPKAILHDLVPFLSRYKTPRPPLKALSFLLFDHIGGINTLLHMLFNKGTVVSIKKRTVENVLKTCTKESIELLPTTPTFLRLLFLYPDLEKIFPKSIKIISYGTERLDSPTLQSLCSKLPKVDFRQTYGMSELGILRVKSKSKYSLYMKVGGEGVETKIIDNLLYIKSQNRMLGYINADSPFDEDGWYCTNDIVHEDKDGFLKITGRKSDVINVGGLKFMPSEIEKICLKFNGIRHVKAYGRSNPITGEHVELIVEESKEGFKKELFINYLKLNLPRHMIPLKIKYKSIVLSHRFKKL